MKHIFKHRGIKISLLLMVLAGVSFVIQNIFYGYIDENNVLQDSIFLPLGFILFFLGFGLFLAYFVRIFFEKN